jgi:hypothetical protein
MDSLLRPVTVYGQVEEGSRYTDYLYGQKYETGRFREGSETRLREFSDLEIGQFCIVQLTRKKSQFAGRVALIRTPVYCLDLLSVYGDTQNLIKKCCQI